VNAARCRPIRALTFGLVGGLLATLLPPMALPVAAVTPCSRGTIALTFDDGPSTTYTPRVLDALASRGVSATFFVVGSRVAASPTLTRRLERSGHRVANHTYRHEQLTRLSTSAVKDTLRRTNSRIVDAGVTRPTLMRPPYRATNSRVRTAAGDLALTQVLWNIDPQDWRTGRSAATITANVLNNLRDGAIVLLHDGVANSGATATAVPRIIDGARARGYCIGHLSATGRVRPPVPTMRISDVEVTEGGPGTTTTARLTVRLSEPTSRTVTVDYRTIAGTATAGTDYRSASGSLSFAVGQTSRTIGARVIGDALDEPNETFSVRLSKVSGAAYQRREARVRIVDDDPPPRVRIRDVSVVEGAAGTPTTVSIPVELDAPSGRPVTVQYATADGTATAGEDYLAVAGTLSFSPGQTRYDLTITVLGDDAFEGDETFVLRLSAPTSATVARGAATITIIDDEPPPASDEEDPPPAIGADAVDDPSD
jgi:peptidoglycan-N-acetylglucosamine deacetylase